MLKTARSGLLHQSSMALINFKGGAGKTVLAGNIASIAAKTLNWKVCVIDLDASAPLTKLALSDVSPKETIKNALALTANGEDFISVLHFAPSLGFWVMPGSVKGITQEEIKYLPHLIHTLKQVHFAGAYVDLVIIDTPGENKMVNGAVLASVDNIAMPLALSATDMTATAVTISFIKQMQSKRKGKPVFLGMIPNRVRRRGTYERSFLDQVLQANVILPYVPDSNTIRGSFSKSGRDGGEVPIYYAPKAVATKRLVHLFEEMNNPNKNYPSYVEEIKDYLGLEANDEVGTDARFETHAAQRRGRNDG
ncbi:ParA family protein [bacterium]|nr:ParA family protein [bacterium]